MLSHLGMGFAQLDTGSNKNLIEASLFIHTNEKRQSLKVACLEDIAYKNKWLTIEDIIEPGPIYKFRMR